MPTPQDQQQQQQPIFQDDDGFIQYVDETYEIEDDATAAVRDRDPSPPPQSDEPTLTFRVWVIGVVLGALFNAINTLLTFRTNRFQISSMAFILIAYPAGNFMAKRLPKGILNPSDFSIQEHYLIFLLASVIATPPHALHNIVVQKYFLKQDLDYLHSLLFALVSQFLGIGLAGLCSHLLLYPTIKLWPTHLATISILTAVHRNKDKKHEETVPDTASSDQRRYRLTRHAAFFIAACALFWWTVLPSYVAPLLSTISILCLSHRSSRSLDRFLPGNALVVKMLGSAKEGVGLLSWTLDWTLVSQHGPWTTSLWSLANQFFGVVVSLWIVIPLVWWVGEQTPNGIHLGAAEKDAMRYPLGFALNSPDLFDRNGSWVDPAGLFEAGTFEVVGGRYAESKPIYMTAYMSVGYANAFAAFVASIVHVALWYGGEFRERFKTARNAAARANEELGEQAGNVPFLWYWILLICAGAAACGVCQFGGFMLPWHGVMLVMALIVVTMMPVGVMHAITGQQVPLNAVTELVAGFIFSGNIVRFMTFKTLLFSGLMQGLSFFNGLKIGRYLKISTKVIFAVQMVGTLIGAVLSTNLVATESFSGAAKVLLGGNLNSTNAWSSNAYRLFLSSGAVWGSYPLDFFGPQGPYKMTLLGFALGLVLPILPWSLHFIYPDSVWHLVNVPLIFSFPVVVGALRSDVLSTVVLSVLMTYFVQKHRNTWWKKYAHVLACAFDFGAGLAVALLFVFSNAVIGGVKRPFPTWALNSNSLDSERCAAELFRVCVGHATVGNGFGHVYDPRQDAECTDFFKE